MVKATTTKNGKVPLGKGVKSSQTSIGDYHRNLHNQAKTDGKFRDKGLVNTANNWAERQMVSSRGKRGFNGDLTAKPVKNKLAWKLSVDGKELRGSYRLTGKSDDPYFKKNWMPKALRTQN